MIITKLTDYALRILRGLLDGELHTVSALAETQQLPQPFAYKIIGKLSKAGLVEVVRGANGGCRLTADLAKVSLYDLMAITEERCDLSACMDPAYHCAWKADNGGCTVHCQLAGIQRTLDRELRLHSLQTILTGT